MKKTTRKYALQGHYDSDVYVASPAADLCQYTSEIEAATLFNSVHDALGVVCRHYVEAYKGGLPERPAPVTVVAVDIVEEPDILVEVTVSAWMKDQLLAVKHPGTNSYMIPHGDSFTWDQDINQALTMTRDQFLQTMVDRQVAFRSLRGTFLVPITRRPGRTTYTVVEL